MKYGTDLIIEIATSLESFEFAHCGMEDTCENCVFAVGTSCLIQLIKDTLGIMIDIDGE